MLSNHTRATGNTEIYNTTDTVEVVMEDPNAGQTQEARNGGNKRQALFKTKLRNTKTRCTNENELKDQRQSNKTAKQPNELTNKREDRDYIHRH